MSNVPPILEAEAPSEADKHLVAIFADIEIKQLDFLDQAGKSIVERIVVSGQDLYSISGPCY